LTLLAVARGLGWSMVNTFRYLATLSELGYLELDEETRRYRPTVKVLRLGAAYLSALSLPELSLPILDRLSARFDQSINLAVRDGVEVVYVARVGSKRILSTNLGVGSRLPAYCTSMGKVLLAWLDEPRLRELLVDTEFKRLTPKTVTSAAALRRALSAVRKQGWAINDQELDLGLRSCSAPVRDRRGEVVAAINVSVSTAQASYELMKSQYVPAVVAAAREITDTVSNRL
jgi:IclR family pca regulon transcriptional regulator